MKKIFNGRRFIALLIGLGLSASAFAETAIPLPSTVVRLKGHARCSTDDGKTWRMIRRGEVIQPGTLVQTAKKSDLDILIGEHVEASVSEVFFDPERHAVHFVSLSEDTALKLDKVQKQTVESGSVAEIIQLDLRRGSMTGKVKKLAAGSRYEIGFIGGVAGMSDTIYKMRASGDITVLKGKAFVALANGQPVREVSAGQDFDPATGNVASRTAEAKEAPAVAKPRYTPAEPDFGERNPRFQLPKKSNSGLRRATPE